MVNENGKRYISDIVDEWLETYDEYEEEDECLTEESISETDEEDD